jgi:hypothetical protein
MLQVFRENPIPFQPLEKFAQQEPGQVLEILFGKIKKEYGVNRLYVGEHDALPAVNAHKVSIPVTKAFHRFKTRWVGKFTLVEVGEELGGAVDEAHRGWI